MSFMGNIEQAVVDYILLWAPRVGIAVVVFLMFWFFARLLTRVITKGSKRLKQNTYITLLIARTAKITLLVLGIVTALGTLGINISAMVAGLGLTGFALGFALKDTISNLLAGVLILLYHPFEIGNRIKIGGYEGTVVSIDLRYTELEAEGNKILIPNSKLFTNPITVLH